MASRSTSLQKAPPGVKEYRLKVVFVGSPGVGKTSLIKRYVNNFFSNAYKATVGADFALKVIDVDAKTRVHLQIWDIAGQERFGTMTKVYYRNATAAVIVYDMTEPKTFDTVDNWRKDLQEKLDDHAGERIPILLLGNKVDAVKEGEAADNVLPNATAEAYVEEKKSGTNFIGFRTVSAKDNVNVQEAMAVLVGQILAYVRAQEHPDSSDEEAKIVKLDDGKGNGDHSEGGCCFGASHQNKFGGSD